MLLLLLTVNVWCCYSLKIKPHVLNRLCIPQMYSMKMRIGPKTFFRPGATATTASPRIRLCRRQTYSDVIITWLTDSPMINVLVNQWVMYLDESTESFQKYVEFIPSERRWPTTVKMILIVILKRRSQMRPLANKIGLLNSNFTLLLTLGISLEMSCMWSLS